MNKDFLTPDELNALFSNDYMEDTESSEPLESADDRQDEGKESHSILLAELQQTVIALTQKVELLEQQLMQESTARMELSAAVETKALLPEEDEAIEPGTFSRIESYGRKRKKKKPRYVRKPLE